MSFERAQSIADAVLFEGYVLYPYRASSTKNRFRWTFGVLAPRAWSAGGGCEGWWLEAQVLVRTLTPRLRVRVRCLRVVERVVRVEGRAVDRLDVDGRIVTPWEEGEVKEIDLVVTGDAVAPFTFPAETTEEPVADSNGCRVGTVVRERLAISGFIRATISTVSLDPPLVRVSLRVENDSSVFPGIPRADAMRASLASTHLLVASEAGDLVSLADPPEELRAFARDTHNVGTYPMLMGAPGERDLMLCAPIILEEHPRIAPESPGQLFDSGEIDEILSLRTRLLLPEEKALARASDPRTAALIDRVDALDEDTLLRLHGVLTTAPPVFTPGTRVRLRPSAAGRRTDAQDLLYEGHTATVEQVLDDVDGRRYLAVTIDDDPAAELHRGYGRFHHYYPDEVERLSTMEAV